MVDIDTEGGSEGEADAEESDEDGLSVARKETRVAPRATTPQLAMMARKKHEGALKVR
jgi:hypothetical protein